MPRTTTFEIVTDTGHFNPLQLQPKVLLSTSFNGLSRWLREHIVSFPSLIRDHKASVVILGSSIAYEKPLGFFDGDTVTIETSLRVLRGGTRAQLDSTFAGANGIAAKVRILLCPVVVEDPESLGASPGRFPGQILERFRPDEIEPGSPDRPLPALKTEIEAGHATGEHREPFVIHRHHCEVADQWAFFEVAALVSASRESFVQSQIKGYPILGTLLARPIKRFEMELTRPYFWLQPGAVETTAYRYQDSVALIHRLTSNIPGEKNYGTIVETF